ncbi:MAG: pyruvate kinase [Paenibacillus sp.]|nr:pyruvate kinase [Paenibacillus sp.]
MDIRDKASTGIAGIDQAVDKLRLGDNVVWQVDSVNDYVKMVQPYAEQTKRDNRRLVYVRFGHHEPVTELADATYPLDASKGFESFATAVHRIIETEGKKAFYIFDSLTDLLDHWRSDLMIGNFFKVACPFLYELDTVAYFAIMRNAHTYSTIATIRETTQLLLDLYHVNGRDYIHPLKVWNRYSPTMFFPHLISGQEAVCITASAETAELFSTIQRGGQRLDYWDMLFQRARDAQDEPASVREETKRLLMAMMLGVESRMYELCDRYFTLEDILALASREIGSGFIGGKSVGMLLARNILQRDGGERFSPYMEPHDSFYIGTDVFYTYIVQNGWWKLRTRQRTKEGYFRDAAELREKLLQGKFPANIREKLVQMLEYFGQSPIIVRSSSLLEDNFGNAFAGKYESVFCANQGTPEERYEALEQAIRDVYASTMNEDALLYRQNRGLSERDEQMAILVQRVSGDHYGDFFAPHVAGVGNSTHLYVWEPGIDREAGMLRLVLGLGTRAVDRTGGDYAKLVCLDNPLRSTLVHAEDVRKFSQHDVDVLSLRDNAPAVKRLEELLEVDLKVDKGLFATPDYDTIQRLRERGISLKSEPHILDFHRLLRSTEFPGLLRDMLALLSSVYDYPVDIEFTANFTGDARFKVNLLQCRPLQTKGLGKSVAFPEQRDGQSVLFQSSGHFMGGNVRLPIDYVVLVRQSAYMALNEQGKYAVARQLGLINAALKHQHALLIGPGRWGTSIPSLGVPVRFSELCYMSAICEVASGEGGMMPELSYGSHFFQDLVETGIFYAALFTGHSDVAFHPERILVLANVLEELLPHGKPLSDVIHVARTDGMELYSDIATQRLICV